MARLRNTASPPDSGDLRERDGPADQGFRAGGARQGRAAGAASPGSLCAVRQPGRRRAEHAVGQQRGTWSERSLVSTFHQEVRSGERFFDVLKQMCSNPGKYLPVIKLMYLCMSLGFIGQYRLSRRGVGDINRIREETYAVIVRQQKAAEPDLAPHTKGIDAPYRPARFRVPLWVAASAGLGIVAAPVPLVLDRPQRDVRRSLRAPADRPAVAHADHHAHAGRRAHAGADAGPAAGTDGARPAAEIPAAGDRAGSRRGDRHGRPAARAHHRPRHVSARAAPR